MILINGQPENRIEIADRGLQYGDGLFETIAYRNGRLEFFPEHICRLLAGSQRLNILFTSEQQQQLEAEVAAVCQQLENDAVIKIILTRGSGGRGYRYQPGMQATRIVSTHPMPVYPAKHTTGIMVRICQQRLANNPVLAGIKHLNRLEQVLARNEWQDEQIAEGLMFDYQDKLIEGTMSNVFLVQNNQLWTPDLSTAGIAGIMRQKLIEIAQQQGISCHVVPLQAEHIKQADEMFMCNSLIGIWPVSDIVDYAIELPHGPLTKQLQQALIAHH